jgi:hypothetical protein
MSSKEKQRILGPIWTFYQQVSISLKDCIQMQVLCDAQAARIHSRSACTTATAAASRPAAESRLAVTDPIPIDAISL